MSEPDRKAVPPSGALLEDRPLARTQFLIIDDFGLSSLTDNERRDLLETSRTLRSKRHAGPGAVSRIQ